jgi:lauroyl/myristoyl acyltransferase
LIFGESRFKDLYRRVTWGPGRRLLESLPAPMEMQSIRAIARVSAAALPDRRTQLRTNLARAFPSWEAARLDTVAREAFAAHFSNQYISFSFSKCTPGNSQKYLEFEGLEHLERASSGGQGVVLMHPHMGPAQLPLHILALRGFEMHQVGGGEVTLVELSETGRWAAETRANLEARMPVTLHDGKKYLRPLIRAVRGGGILMTAGDATGGGQELGRRLIRTVLGQSYGVPIGPIWMAWRSGAPLLSIHCVRNRKTDGALFRAIIQPELPLDRELPLRAALAQGADLVASWLDTILRDHPGDWLFWDGFRPGGLLPEGTRR